MLQNRESQRRAGRENIKKRHFRKSWVQTSGVDANTIPQMEWACPPRFVEDPNWRVEVGSQSKETHIQLQRESTTPEAIYYLNSDIPANPCIASAALVFDDDDSKVPIIPLVGIDDEVSADDDDNSTPLTTLDPTVKVGEPTAPLTVSPLGPPQVKEVPEADTQALLQRNQAMVTAVAPISLMKAKEPGSQIDLGLLVHLLSNPSMLEQLVKGNGDSAKPQARSFLPLSVPKPSLEVRPARTVGGSTPVVVPKPNIKPVVVPKPSVEVRPAKTVVRTTPVAVPGPTITHVVVPKPSLEVRPARTVGGSTSVVVPKPNIKPVVVPKPSIEFRPARTVVRITPVSVPGPTITHVVVPKPSLEVRPARTVGGSTSVVVPKPNIKPVVVPKPSIEFRPARTVVRITPVSVPGPTITHVVVQKPSLEVRPARTVVKTTPVEVPVPNRKPVAVPKPSLEVRPARSVVETEHVAVPGPAFTNIAKVPVGAHSKWAPSVPFTHSMSQGVKDTTERIHMNPESLIPYASKSDLDKIRKLINEYGVPLGDNGNSYSLSAPKTGPVVIKDSDYYRGLVSQHGITQENPNLQGSVKTIRSHEQPMCVYFNSPKGCRRGSACFFQHVKVNMETGRRAVVEPQGAKRMKLYGGNFAGHT